MWRLCDLWPPTHLKLWAKLACTSWPAVHYLIFEAINLPRKLVNNTLQELLLRHVVALKNIPLKSRAWNFIIVNHLIKRKRTFCHFAVCSFFSLSLPETWAQRLAQRLQWTNYRMWTVAEVEWGGGRGGVGGGEVMQLIVKLPWNEHPVSGLGQAAGCYLHHISGSESRSPLCSVSATTSAANVPARYQIWKPRDA